jgi:hypothetical protein
MHKDILARCTKLLCNLAQFPVTLYLEAEMLEAGRLSTFRDGEVDAGIVLFGVIGFQARLDGRQRASSRSGPRRPSRQRRRERADAS